MELINGLLGFAVLTSPLWLIVILLPVSIWVAIKIAKRFKKISAKLASAFSVFLLVFLVIFADEIVGKMYLDHLCATEAGVKVYQTVELPAEYWDENGLPKFRVYEGKRKGQTIFSMGSKEWEKSSFEYGMYVESYSQVFHINKSGFRLQERESEVLLGEVVYFTYWGGWFARNLTIHNSAISCDMTNLDEWKYNIFVPSVTNRIIAGE